MRLGGHIRKRIARTLSAAYAAGLLSEDTYLHRVDSLLSSAVIEPSRLAGDLNFRRARPAWRQAASRAVGRVLDRVRDLAGRPPPDPAILLALDWDGGTASLSVGRHHDCDVVFSAPDVSRRHALLRFRDGRWILQDLDSRNGTFVNGVRVDRCELRPGDQLALGGKAVVID